MFEDAYREGLMELHDEETHEMLGYPVRPNQGYYQALEEQGVLVTFTARVGDQLVGYATFFVQGVIHTDAGAHAHQDSIFMHPDWRSGGNSVDFIRYCDGKLAEDGVISIQWGMPPRRGYDRIFAGLGYRKAQYVYVRRVR